MSQNLTEAENIQRAIAGDRLAFRWLVEKHQRFVYSVSYRFLGNSADAEDATQETFVRLWKNLAKYKPEIKLSTWLYRITANLCLDLLKSSRHRTTRNTVLADESIAAGQLSDNALMMQEFREAVQKFALSLHPRQKAVYVLRELEGLSVEEVSQVLSMSSDAIKSNLYHARLQISKWMKEYYGEKKKLEL